MRVETRIKQLRIEQHMSIGELSRLSGVSKSHISYIENGYKIPTITTICMLSRALGVCVGAIIVCRNS
jgi:transcriptional regulator with XRE-family HTH domain